jgi:hypothetical protein
MESKPNGAILKLIKMTYTGEELEAMLKAWNDFPTYKTDCPNEQRIKEELRKLRAERYLKTVVPFDNGNPNHFVVKIEK